MAAILLALPLGPRAAAQAALTVSSKSPTNGQTVAGPIVWEAVVSGGTATKVEYSVDGRLRWTENFGPWIFNGTGGTWDTTKETNGSHTLTLKAYGSGGVTATSTITVTVANGTSFRVSSKSPTNGQTVAGPIVWEAVVSGGTATKVEYSVDGRLRWTENFSPWTFNGTGGTWDTTKETNGSHTLSLKAYGSGGVTATSTITVTVANGTAGTGCTNISPLPCSRVLVSYPYRLVFGGGAGGVVDRNGVGTGFTMVDPAASGKGYDKTKLLVDTTASGTLKITTTKGLASTTSNSLDNALGVGVDAPDHVSLLSTTLRSPPAGTGNFEQGGLWFGNDQDNYVKLVVLSTASGTKIEYLMEVEGAKATSVQSAALSLSGATVSLSLRANPTDRRITASYAVNGAAAVTLGTFTAPPEFFSADAAGIDPTIGTRSFGGVFASHRNGPSPLTYAFDNFSLTDASGSPPPPPPPGGQISFTRSSFAVPNPTAMVWGPDGRLYVTELYGKIHAFTLNAAKQPTAEQVITTLGSRLTLGITVDPASTASNVILWVSHSNPSVNNGQANSSTVSKLSGPAFTRQDVITGLPRAIANHSINSLHFGPDGKLYMAHGGNTGAGAPNTATTEFGNRAEQPLSAAILVADVKAPGFGGSCATPLNSFGVPASCSVRTYATGLRNAYDLVWHSNGSLYSPDNGLGVTGTFPPKPTPPCTGFANTAPWSQGGHNPGAQPDVLLRVLQGKYYGHPNPYRNECVFKDGRFQNVAPAANYAAPMYTLGSSKSANGIIEYRAGTFGGALQGNLLIANYSQGNDITRLRLSGNGTSVLSAQSLAGGFADPLPITEGPDGTIYVGEFGGGKVTALVPNSSESIGRWTTKQPLPEAILDAGGSALGGKLYVVAGKTSTAHLRSLYVYDPGSNGWTKGPDLPAAYPAVENPAVVGYGGKLYVFGGSTGPFSGAVTSAAVYDPASDGWTMLPEMPIARGGPAAQAVGSKIYVVGGMDAGGSSLATVSVYDPAAGSWDAAPNPMGTRRDNPGAAVLGGKLYVFGGRTRNADGTSLNDTLATVEMFDPATGQWAARAPMPTGRRTMVVGTLNERAQVMGGERTPSGGSFSQNEEYDPVGNTWRTLAPMQTPRHGAAGGTIDGLVYAAGGGPTGGSSFTTVIEAFGF